MKKKRLMIVGIMAALVIVIGAMAINQSPRWSEKSFEAIVQEIVMQPDGEIRLIVERTTEIYGALNKMDAEICHSDKVQQDTERIRREQYGAAAHDRGNCSEGRCTDCRTGLRRFIFVPFW